MGGESSMATVESGLEAPAGSENELLRIRGAQLCLIDGKESVIVQTGDFAFHVIKQSQSPLAAAVGLVGDLQWPVGRDSPSLKVGSRKYVFALPGLLYGLLLPPNTPMEAEQSFEGLLHQYSAFEPNPEISAGVDESDQGWLVKAKQEGADYWTSVAPQVEKISTKMARKIFDTWPSCATWSETEFSFGGFAATSPNDGVADDDDNAPAVQGGTGIAGNNICPRMLNRIQRARRMSAVAKLLSKTLLRGAINASSHVVAGQQSMTEPPATSLPSSGSEDGLAALSLASVDACARVVEAVETAGRSLLELVEFQHQLKDHEQQQQSTCPEGADWTLNKSGLRLLLRATAVSAVIHMACGIGAPSLSPTQSSPQSVLTQQPSEAPSEELHTENYTLYNSAVVTHAQPLMVYPDRDSVAGRPAAASTRVPHRPNSPFQQYKQATGAAVADSQTTFGFSLGFDSGTGRQAQQQQQPQQNI